MDALATHAAALPDGKVVTVSLIPDSWWSAHEGTGYVHPNVLAPDPTQPRRHMDEGSLEVLEGSIAASGVRERIIATPVSHVPWAEVAEEHRGRFFLIVSGHRRWRAASKAMLGAVPIEVRIYPDKKEHSFDRSVLNKGRGELTALDEGYEIISLRADGWTMDELGRRLGYNPLALYARINLTKLHPDIQTLLVPRKGSKRTVLQMTTAAELGSIKAPTPDELDHIHDALGDAVGTEYVVPEAFDVLSADERRFTLQKLLLSVIQKRSLGTIRARELIKEQTLKFVSSSAGHKSTRYQPRKRKEVLDTLVKAIMESVVMDWSPQELVRIFELAPREEVEEYMRKIRDASDFLAGLVKSLGRICDKKPVTSPEVQKLMRRIQGHEASPAK